MIIWIVVMASLLSLFLDLILDLGTVIIFFSSGSSSIIFVLLWMGDFVIISLWIGGLVIISLLLDLVLQSQLWWVFGDDRYSSDIFVVGFTCGFICDDGNSSDIYGIGCVVAVDKFSGSDWYISDVFTFILLYGLLDYWVSDSKIIPSIMAWSAFYCYLSTLYHCSVVAQSTYCAAMYCSSSSAWAAW